MAEEAQDDIERADQRMRQAEKEIEEMRITGEEYEKFERDFQQVLQELAGDRTIERFRMEYEKLYRTLKASLEFERRLIKKCKELNAEINANALKVQVALKLTREETQAIAEIKQQVDSTWKIVDATREKETDLKKRIASKKGELADLARKLENGDVAPVSQQDQLRELVEHSKEQQRDLEDTLTQLREVTAKNAELLQRERTLITLQSNLENDVKTINEQITEAKKAAEEGEAKKKLLDQELTETKKKVEDAKEGNRKLTEAVGSGRESISSLTLKIQELTGRINEQKAIINRTSHDKQNLEDALENQNGKNSEVVKANDEKEDRIKMMEHEYERSEEEVEEILKEITVLAEKRHDLDMEKIDSESLKEAKRRELDELRSSNDRQRRQNDLDRKEIEKTLRSIQLLTKSSTTKENEVHDLDEVIMMKRNELKKVMNEIQGSKNESAKISAIIAQLERDKERYKEEAKAATSKYVQYLEELKGKNSMISECQRKNREALAKLKQQIDLYKTVRSDKNIYSKNLLESTEEIKDLRQKFKILQHQIEQLRDEISIKDNMIRDENMNRDALDMSIKQYGTVKQQKEERKKQMSIGIEHHEQEIAKLKHIIANAEQERIKQKKEYEMVINDRDILGTQLIKRNEELATLYEKIKIQQSTLTKGEVQYQERVFDIVHLRETILNLKKELVIAKRQIENLPDLKREAYQLQHEIMQAKTKVKALKEEAKNPMNVHRYRKLEGTSPETYEMINKIQTLQRRLIAKTEEVEEKDFLIKEKEKLYVELKNILARQPGPEVAEHLTAYQDTLKDKTKQMKTMVKELKIYQAQVNEYKFEIERLTGQIQAMKRKWFDEQLKERRESQPEAAPNIMT